MIDAIRNLIEDKAKDFGAKEDSYLLRDNTEISFKTKNPGAYFGFVEFEEGSSGVYHDFSLVFFPSDEKASQLAISLGVGTQGFKNDFNLATYPGLRRFFKRIINDKGYCKTNFADIESRIPKKYVDLAETDYLAKSIEKYKTFLPAIQIVDNPVSEEGKKIITAFVAGYAKIRNWPSNNNHRKAISNALEPFFKEDSIDDKELIRNLLLEKRRFIILQGAPGTGKTTIAKKIAAEYYDESFFTQFHAETTYSDFIYGIRPKLNGEEVGYEGILGNLTQAVKFALANPLKNVILIIDEINRANLSNVLGPVFYLFEHKMTNADVAIKISPELEIKMLPKNLDVIATMNTADRSLAVVDFALRRRFAWYNLKPKPLSISNFHKDDFNKIAEIFNWYASSNELNLQPGQGYFIADNEEEMKNRIRYEIFPLIKEYLQEGLLTSAIEEFNSYFSVRINQSLFE